LQKNPDDMQFFGPFCRYLGIAAETYVSAKCPSRYRDFLQKNPDDMQFFGPFCRYLGIAAET